MKEFGTGNKEHQQIIEQCEAFLNAYGFSRYLPYPESDARDLPIKELAGYRTGNPSGDEVYKFYTFLRHLNGRLPAALTIRNLPGFSQRGDA